MGPLMLESLQAFGPSRIQKIALRSTADGTPACLVTLYQGQKLHFGFLGSKTHCEPTPLEAALWNEAMPSKSQASFRHHLLNTELKTVTQTLGTFVLTIVHKDGKPRQLVIEPGKKSYCILLLQIKDDRARIIAYHGAPEDKTKRRKVGQLYQPPSTPLRAFNASVVSALAPSPSPADPLRTRLQTEKARLKRLQKNIKNDVKKLGEPQALYEQGHLLTGHLETLVKGQTEVKLPAPDGRMVYIPLRPDKTPAQNSTLIFSKAKKAQRGLTKIKPRLLAIEVQLRVIQELLDKEDLASEEVDQVLAQKHWPSARRKAALAGPTKPWRCFQVNDSAFVWVVKMLG